MNTIKKKNSNFRKCFPLYFLLIVHNKKILKKNIPRNTRQSNKMPKLTTKRMKNFWNNNLKINYGYLWHPVKLNRNAESLRFKNLLLFVQFVWTKARIISIYRNVSIKHIYNVGIWFLSFSEIIIYRLGEMARN